MLLKVLNGCDFEDAGGLAPQERSLTRRWCSGEVLDDGIELLWGAFFLLAGVTADDGHFDIITADRVLHHVLQGLENHLLGLLEAHSRVVLFLDRLHGSLLASADGIGLPLSVGS